MTTTPDPWGDSAPDAISARELSRFLEHAPENADDVPIPIGDNVPPLALSSDGGGILDLAVFLEQVIAHSETGCSILHMLQAAGWILAGCHHRLCRDIERMQAETPELESMIQQMRQDADSLRGISALIEKITTPASSAAVMAYLMRHGFPGRPRELPRQIFVSDELLDQLGVDRDQYTRFIRQRVDLG